MNHRSTSSQSREFINEVYPASKSREVEEIDFPKDKFDTEGDQRNETPAKRTTKRRKRRASTLFFFLVFLFFFYGDRRRPREAGSLKMIRSTKEGCNPRWDSFFFVIIISWFPRTRGAFRTGRTGRTLERAGSGSHLDVERRTVRVPRSLVMVLSEKSISLDRVSTWRGRLLSLDDWEEISRHRSNFSSKIHKFPNARDFHHFTTNCVKRKMKI